jgi:hypothetical protein
MKIALVGCFVLAALTSTFAADHPRVYVTDSKSWEIKAGVGGTSDGFGGAAGGGDRPQTAEIIKTFNERCADVIINNNKDKVDYIVLLDHEGGKDAISRDNKVVVFNREGDAIMSKSTRLLGNAVKDACAVITTNWSGVKARARYSQEQDAQQAKVTEQK